ncbi:MAG: DUF2905 domain-containing protein [Gammaproteobacteria bacterium]
MFILLGVLLIALGVLWPLLKKCGIGHLPGDILIRRGDSVFYFPITTCIIISMVFSIIMWLLNR